MLFFFFVLSLIYDLLFFSASLYQYRMFRFWCFFGFWLSWKNEMVLYVGFQPHFVGRRRATGIQMALFESL